MKRLICVAVVACGGGDADLAGSEAPASVDVVGERAREAAIRATVAAAGAGDVERLLALVDPVGTFALDCTNAKPVDSSDQATFRDPARMRTSMRDTFARELEALRGTTLAIRAIEASPGPSHTYKVGDSVSGCVVTKPYAVWAARVELAVGEPAWTDATYMVLIAIDGRYHPLGPPRVRSKPFVFAELENQRDEMCACRDRACADSVDGRHIPNTIASAHGPITDDDTRRADAIEQAYTRCEQHARGVFSWNELAAMHAERAARLCACKDRACAEAVKADTRVLDRVDLEAPLDAARQRRLDDEQKRIDACEAKLARK
jgi:hypothetical protein